MRIGEFIWHCKRISDHNSPVQEFELPYRIQTRLGYLTVQPSGSSYSELTAYGEEVKDYQTIVAQPYNKWYGVFNEGDRLFLDGAKPTGDDLNDQFASNANYIVDSVKNQNAVIRVICKKRTEKQL